MADEQKVQVWIASDSTAADYPPESMPMIGWGQRLGRYLDEKVILRNEAMNGRSSKSFIQEGRLARIEEQIGPGDYLFIQFGHNDAKLDEERHTEADGDYAVYIQRYIDTAKNAGAIPVLITSLERRHVDESGLFVPTHGAYPEAIRRIAADQQLALIDLCAKSMELYQRLGVEASKRLFAWFAPGEQPNYPEGLQDNTHLCEYGASVIAGLVAVGIRECGLALAKHVIQSEHTDSTIVAMRRA